MPSPEQTEKARMAAEMSLVPTKFQALKARGWWQPLDWIMLGIFGGSLVTLFFWWVFGTPTVLSLIAVLLVDILIALAWLIILSFRCACFVLETQADINLMPESAARIAAAFITGNGSTQKR
jgi:hypothetical protein